MSSKNNAINVLNIWLARNHGKRFPRLSQTSFSRVVCYEVKDINTTIKNHWFSLDFSFFSDRSIKFTLCKLCAVLARYIISLSEGVQSLSGGHVILRYQNFKKKCCFF